MKHFWSAVSCLVLFLATSAYGAGLLRTVVVDPGHGGYDVGIQSGQNREKDVALSLAREMKAQLLEIQVDVELTRKIDHYATISERRSNANAQSPDVFLSLHLSEGEHFTVYTAWYEKPYTDLGIREFYAIESRQRRYLYDSERLARVVADTIRDQLKGTKVYVRKMPLPLISSIGAPSIMIEVPSRGMTYPADLNRVAAALVQGLLRYDEQ